MNKDTLLSVAVGDYDGLYRIRRDTAAGKSTVIYVELHNVNIVAEDRRTFGPWVIGDLRRAVDVWDHDWTTLDVLTEDGKVCGKMDQWPPHSLSPKVMLNDLPRANVLDIDEIHRYKSTVSSMEFNSQPSILKFCPWGWMMNYFTRGARTYQYLTEQKCDLAPALLAYVYERDENHIIGFVCEALSGVHPSTENYTECKRALSRFHSYGVVHGDLNKYNMLKTTDGLKFIDFEDTRLAIDDAREPGDFESQQQEEMQGLMEALADEGGVGKPWLPSSANPSAPESPTSEIHLG